MVEVYNEKSKLVNFEVPEEMAIAYQQFLSFFVEYVKVIKGKKINFDITRRGGNLAIDIELENSELKMDEVNDFLKEYTDLVGKVLEPVVLNVENSIPKADFDIFVLRLEGQLNSLKQELKIAEIRNHYLQENKEEMKLIVEKLTGKPTNVYVQMLNGGESQFADQINNK